MKIVLLALAVVVGLAALVAAAGMILPAEHRATSRAVYHRAPAEVWSVISDLGAGPAWRSGVERIERLDAPGERWRETGSTGAMTFDVQRDPAARRMVTRIVGDGAFGGSWTYRVDEHPDGAAVTITEDGEIYNPVFRVVARYVMGYHGTLDRYLRSLGERFGEAVEPTHLEEPS